MSITITRRDVGDVTIFEIKGRITLGEGSKVFRDTIRQHLLQGKRKLLLDLSGVGYLDSSGIYELQSALGDTIYSDGALKILNLQKRVHDLLQITKLYTFLEVFDDEAEALQSFQFDRRYCHCPVCSSQARPPQLDRGEWGIQVCPSCSCRFTVRPAERSDREVLVTGAQIGTHENEYLQVSAGAPFNVKIVGRLDLFVSTALSKMWQAMPPPRRILFDISGVTEAAPAGAKFLLDLLAARRPEDSAVVSLEGLSPVLMQVFPSAPEVFTSKADAMHALGDVSDTPKWISRVSRFNYFGYFGY